MKLNRKLMTVVLAAVLAMLLAIGALADNAPTIDKTATGTVTVTKYQYNTGITTGTATGTTADARTDLATLSDVSFTLTQVVSTSKTIEYYNGSNTQTYTVDQFLTTTDTGVTIVDSSKTIAGEGEALIVKGGTIGSSGTITFTDLPVGIYVLLETSAPSSVSEKAEPTLISVPMVNTSNTTTSSTGNTYWLYDIHVYPKNETYGGNMQIVKKDQAGNGLNGIQFTLNRYTDDTYAVIDDTFTAQTVTTASETVDGETVNGRAEIKNLGLGYYALTESAGLTGYIQNTDTLYFQVNKDNTVTYLGRGTKDAKSTTDLTDLTVGYTTTYSTANDTIVFTIVNEMPSMTKLVANNGGQTSTTTDTYVDDTQYSIGDAVPYQITVDVPASIAHLKTFTVTDTPSVGLTDNTNSITVTPAGGTALTAGTDYTVRPVAAVAPTAAEGDTPATAGNGAGFILTFTTDGWAKVADKQVVIAYTATLNGSAAIGAAGNANTAELEYSTTYATSSVTETGRYTIDDMATVYTYQYSITKHKDTTDGDTMDGVKFQLLTSKTGSAVSMVSLGDGKYRPALTGETGVTTLTTADGGKLILLGLENGTYYLKETETLTGYNLLSEPYEFEIKVTESTAWEPTATATWSNGKLVQQTNPVGTLTISDAAYSTDLLHADVINKQGFTLPQTGSLGYLAYCAIGIVLIGGGAALLISGRKKKVK